MDKLFFGAAYYPEYLPEQAGERMDTDFALMRKAGFNLIRIAESTWSTLEPREGEYDFTWIDRVLDKVGQYGLSVIIGTPTYAVPAWLVKKDPGVLSRGKNGPRPYGTRQIMNLLNATYRSAAEKVIRALAAHTAQHPAVIGWQIDNETKHYGSYDPEMQRAFVESLKQRFGTVEAMNRAFGLAYWSNSIGAWEDFPDMVGCINGSLCGEYEAFRRQAAADFLGWQRCILDEYRRPDQFVTHNMDFEWRTIGAANQQNGYSYGMQPDISHYETAKHLTLTGGDVYHPSQDRLTGKEIAFAGDSLRPLRPGGYLVLETQTQAFKQTVPYPGQLRLCAYSHLASGAVGVEYWPWQSIHNSFESYWKGILSHDMQPGRIYDEVAEIGNEWKRLGETLTGLEKTPDIALLTDQRSLTALYHFPIDKAVSYNDAVRRVYDALYELNAECDVVDVQAVEENAVDLGRYKLVLTPALYCASESLIARLRDYVSSGGHLFSTFRSFVASPDCTIYPAAQPCGMTDVFGVYYREAAEPVGVQVDDTEIHYYMELLQALDDETRVLARYVHPVWGGMPACTERVFGKGSAWYAGFCPEGEWLKKIFADTVLPKAGIERPAACWPLAVKTCQNSQGDTLRFLLNFSAEPQTCALRHAAMDLLSDTRFAAVGQVTIPGWGVMILRETV